MNIRFEIIALFNLRSKCITDFVLISVLSFKKSSAPVPKKKVRVEMVEIEETETLLRDHMMLFVELQSLYAFKRLLFRNNALYFMITLFSCALLSA